MHLGDTITKAITISLLLVLLLVAVCAQPVAAESLVPYIPENILRAHGVALTQRAVVAALRKNKNILVRRSAAYVLAKHWPTAAVPILQQALSSEQDPFTRLYMAGDLVRLDDPLGRKTLISECHDSAWGSVRMYAATVLSRDFGDDSCLDSVLDVLQAESDPNNEGAREMALNLAPILIRRVDKRQSDIIFELLVGALLDPQFGLRLTACDALEALGDVRAIPGLQAAIAGQPDVDSLEAMNRALKTLQRKIQTQ